MWRSRAAIGCRSASALDSTELHRRSKYSTENTATVKVSKTASGVLYRNSKLGIDSKITARTLSEISTTRKMSTIRLDRSSSVAVSRIRNTVLRSVGLSAWVPIATVLIAGLLKVLPVGLCLDSSGCLPQTFRSHQLR